MRRSSLAFFCLVLAAACGPKDSPAPSSNEDAGKPGVSDGPFRRVELVAFRHHPGDDPSFPLRAIMSGGGGLGDLDGDGDLDIVCVQGAASAGPTRLLFRDGPSAFRTVDLPVPEADHQGMGCALGDADGDGDLDLFLSAAGPDRFFRNDGEGGFRDATTEVGLGDQGYASSALWFDADGDRDLDLYVTRYVGDTHPEPFCRSAETGARDYCNPTSYPKTRDLLYRNEGGHFVEIGAEAGLATRRGYGLAVISSDFDNDGDLDLYVANDQSPAFLWRNDGTGHFVDVAMETGCALDGDGAAIAGMGLVAEDFDGDADFDLFVTNIRERDHLFLRRDDETWSDVSARWGRPDWLRPRTGFGVAAFDQDHDGRLDLYLANGSVMARAQGGSPGDQGLTPYVERDDFLRFDGTRFTSAKGSSPPDIARGLARGDIDGDGDIDLVVFRNRASPLLLMNERRSPGHWLVIDVREANGAPALNARVRLETSAGPRLAEQRAQESYLSSRDPRAHFGLAAGTEVLAMHISWADGRRESMPAPDLDRVWIVTPPASEPKLNQDGDSK